MRSGHSRSYKLAPIWCPADARAADSHLFPTGGGRPREPCPRGRVRGSTLIDSTDLNPLTRPKLLQDLLALYPPGEGAAMCAAPAARKPTLRRRASYADEPRGTAEITTTACAIGPSSVRVTSMRASQFAGVIALSRASAPPVSAMVGRPEGKLITPMSRQNTPARRPVPSALSHASLAAKRPATVSALRMLPSALACS